MEIYRVEGLSFTYPNQDSRALDNVSFSVKEGEFITLCGPSGCGKSTLLRQLKPALAPHGDKDGRIFYKDCLLDEVDLRTLSGSIGFVLQSPENQIVTDKVWHELAFGLESLGCDTPTIRRRVAEMASFFGIQTWFYRDVAELSGGQKQLLNLASIMVMNPSVLILDEPTSQLDPIASSEFLSTVGRINRELGTTVIMTEHRLEEVLSLSSRLLAMEGGRLILDGAPEEVGENLRRCNSSMFLSMPTPMRLYAALNGEGSCPVNVRDGRDWISRYAQNHEIIDIDRKEKTAPPSSDTAVELDGVWFRYERQGNDIVKGLSIKAGKGEFLALLGGNGTGKTTTLTLISGINKPHRGKIKLLDRDIADIKKTELFDGLIGVLPQNPQALFVKSSVFEDLLEILPKTLDKTEREKRAYSSAKLCNIERLLDRHPYDLSGGEQQRAALAKVLLLRPKILLLDEPTKGLDSDFKRTFASIINKLTAGGVTVIMVSHDVEFCASYAHRCALFFDGSIVDEGAPGVFFSGNSFYTTAANRMVRHLIPGAVVEEDVIKAFGGKVKKEDIDIDFDGGSDEYFKLAESKAETKKKAALPCWRRALGCAFGALVLVCFIYVIRIGDYKSMFDYRNMGIYAVLLLSMLGLALSLTTKTEKAGQITKTFRQKLPQRTLAALLIIIVAVPLTIFAGIYFFGGRKYYFISLLVIIETMLPFLLAFESRRPQARELIIISVLCAIGVAGRTAFYMLPYASPVLAVVIITGAALGGEAGFLVGAMTAFVSNFFFGQGPWTPWQMFGMGLIGFIAGIIFRNGLIRPGRLPLCIYGGLAAVLIYGGLLNPATVIIYYNTINWDMIFAAYVTGLPADLVHGASTVIFLWLASRPMLEKLDRIKTKYGLYDTSHKPVKQDKTLINC